MPILVRIEPFPHLTNLPRQHLIIVQMTIRLFPGFATPRKPPALPSTISSHKGGHREGGLTKKLRNYLLWTTILGGQTPYYSTVSAFLTLPPLPILTTTSAISPLPTSAIINVIYAMSYPVNPISLDTRRKSRRWCRNRCSCYCDAIHHCSILFKKKRLEDLKPS